MDPLCPQGDYISKEQFCKEAHISKHKALALIQSGLVPAIDTHRQTRRYWIAREDMLRYMQERVADPAKYGRTIAPKMLCQGVFAEYDPRRATKLRKTIARLWGDEPDMLSAAQVAKLLGYNKKVVQQWLCKWDVERIKVQRGMLFRKESVISVVAGPAARCMKYKSPKHYRLLEKAMEKSMEST